MNERERKEFEHHKKIAEEQLNKMYLGANKAPQKGGGLPFPSFVSPTLNSSEKPSENNSNAKRFSENWESKSNSSEKTSPSKRGGYKNNILDFLNLKGIKMDNDRLIILAICLLLSNEEVDELLLIALVYIML